MNTETGHTFAIRARCGKIIRVKSNFEISSRATMELVGIEYDQEHDCMSIKIRFDCETHPNNTGHDQETAQ